MIKSQNNARWLFFSLFVLVTLMDTTTNQEHYAINRYLLLIVSFIVCAGCSVSLVSTVKSKSTRTLLLYFFGFVIYIYTHGFVLSVLFGGGNLFILDSKLLLYSLISIVFSVFLFSHFLRSSFSDSRSELLIYFAAAAFLLLWVGSVDFSFPPHIDFRPSENSVRSYSQGVSSFFSMAAIAFYVELLAKQPSRPLQSIVLCCFMLMGIFFVMLGGGRGEFLALIFILFWASVNMVSMVKIFVVVFITAACLVYGFSDIDLTESLKVVDRLSKLGDVGSDVRETLYIASLDLLSERPICLVTGCGFNYFQVYNSYEASSYPHNIIIEMLITFGLVGFIVLLLALYGIFRSNATWGKLNPVFYIMVYTLIIFLKSGSLFSLLSLPLLLFFSFLGFMCVKKIV